MPPKYIAMIYVKESSIYVFCWEFYGFWTYIRSLIHFYFIFVYGIRKCSNFILFFFLSHLSFYFCERIQRRALIQVGLEAFEEDLSLDEVIQTQILNT